MWLAVKVVEQVRAVKTGLKAKVDGQRLRLIHFRASLRCVDEI